LVENVRFNLGEAMMNDALSRKMAALCDGVCGWSVLVPRTTRTSVTHGVAEVSPQSLVQEPLLSAELKR